MDLNNKIAQEKLRLESVFENWQLQSLEILTREILKKISLAAAKINIEDIRNEFTREIGLLFYKTTIIDNTGEAFYGYSCGDENARMISIVEAFERFAFIKSINFEKEKSFELPGLISQENKKYNFTVDQSDFYESDLKYKIQQCNSSKFNLYFNFMDNDPVLIRESIAGFNSTTSGCASHLNIESALEHGLLEIVERDTLMRHWLKRKSFQKNEEVVMNDFVARLSSVFKKYNYTLEFYLSQSQWGTPVSIAILKSDSGHFPFAFFGCGAGINIESATLKSLKELMVKWTFDFSSYSFTGKVSELLEDQANIYLDPANWSKVSNYFPKTSDTNKINWHRPNGFSSFNEFKEHVCGISKIYFTPMYFDEGDLSPYGIKVRSPDIFPMFFGNKKFQFPISLALGPEDIQYFQLHPF
jgi:hypothetical protein